VPAGATSDFDGWEFDEQLKHLGRLIEADKRAASAEPGIERPFARLDPAHGRLAPPHAPVAQRADDRRADDRHSSFSGPLAWTALSLGTMAFVCGGILLGWSIVADRQDLWTVGLPIALGGQVALLVGLIFQLDRLWSDNRAARSKLDEVDERLHELKTTTTLLGTTHSSPATAFYSHLAEGAHPQLLLTDLKSQLDLLALKLSRDS
jgi:hypothetical protein